ncbi:putative adenine deaminase [Collibacillus ludicampi]|uniref:adenine deaminase n=1 Tax=Collibacillus ludicampi TaxID=2771369 RepID=A0AAV4LC07_9BACL|nr:adenine deaminase C-terminal domain-containing protein [Collibacillus ludicampi]GIM44997.1 putative adenine deaminase [Collibacillus ludicampi]
MGFVHDGRRRIRPLTISEFRSLMRVSKGIEEADVYFCGGTVCNVYSGEWINANVAVKGRHIAYVGMSDQMVGENTRVIDVHDQYIVPGYMEPHAHPFQLYNPYTFAQFALLHGTTFLVNDNLTLYLTMPIERMEEFFHEAGQWPVKMTWWARFDPQTSSPESESLFDPVRIRRLLGNPYVLQGGELTAWPQILAGTNDELELNLWEAGNMGKRVEGHMPGASIETLSAMTAAGVTACHEAMTGEEALRRLRLGLWTSLRYSSLRPDLPVLIRDLLLSQADFHRMMMTTDGATPAFLERGLTDEMVRVAIESGLEPMRAYQMVTVQPAMYYGIDGEVGGIAPGRIADLLLLSAPTIPTPEQVWADGKLAASQGELQIDWKEPDWAYYGQSGLLLDWLTVSEDFYLQEDEKVYVIDLENPAITRIREGITADDLTGILITRDGKHAVRSAVRGFARRLDGMASSFTASGDFMALGRNPAAMQQALNRVLQIGGGIVLIENGEVLFELALPLAGKMSKRPLTELTVENKKLERLLSERGYPHYDLIYTLLFFTSTHLPEVRFTPRGILHVKSGEILVPAKVRRVSL